MKLIGPFTELITLEGTGLKGPVSDTTLNIIKGGGILIKSEKIQRVGEYNQLYSEYKESIEQVEDLNGDHVGVPGLIDCHTHIVFGGSRANDFEKKLAGKSYNEISAEGGGIINTVNSTRNTGDSVLIELARQRIKKCIQNGITTLEVKSGYGLSASEELRLLRIINIIKSKVAVEVLPTCLAAHTLPPDFSGSKEEYLRMILDEIIPLIKKEKLCHRQDIFVEKSAFGVKESYWFLEKCRDLGFDITVHADQFSVGGSQIGVDLGASSVDHLEVSGDKEIKNLAKSDTVGVVLPGASLGLGIPFAAARDMLDAGVCLAIASDWNPGSAPMGDLLTQACLLAIYQKLTFAEVLSGMTFRAAKALNMPFVGKITSGYQGDICSFPIDDYREILYNQGTIKVNKVWKKGNQIYG